MSIIFPPGAMHLLHLGVTRHLWNLLVGERERTRAQGRIQVIEEAPASAAQQRQQPRVFARTPSSAAQPQVAESGRFRELQVVGALPTTRKCS